MVRVEVALFSAAVKCMCLIFLDEVYSFGPTVEDHLNLGVWI